jgi:hypothetical protein
VAPGPLRPAVSEATLSRQSHPPAAFLFNRSQISNEADFAVHFILNVISSAVKHFIDILADYRYLATRLRSFLNRSKLARYPRKESRKPIS